MIKKFIFSTILWVVYTHIIEAIIYYFKDAIIASQPLYFCIFIIAAVTLGWDYFMTKLIKQDDKKE